MLVILLNSLPTLQDTELGSAEKNPRFQIAMSLDRLET